MGSATFYVDSISFVPIPQVVYGDSLSANWADYSFPRGVANFAATSFVRAGSKSIAVSATQNQGLYLHNKGLSFSRFDYGQLRYGHDPDMTNPFVNGISPFARDILSCL